MKEKVILAYSGGLDTTAIIPWLKENYDYEVICCCIDCGQEEELDGLEERAISCGASKLYIVDIIDEFCDDYIMPCVQANAIYENKYLLGTSMARPLIAKKLVEVARKEGATAICHGATGKGNDQIRFELGIKALAPDLKIIAAWRDPKWTMDSRESEIEYCKAHGIHLPFSADTSYSRDRNIWHISHEGLELEDPACEPNYDHLLVLGVSPEKAPEEGEYVTMTFEKGVPTSVNGKEMKVSDIIRELNRLGGKHGVGIIDIVENRVVGMKSRGVYETPGGTILMEAHQQLEELVLDRATMEVKKDIVVAPPVKEVPPVIPPVMEIKPTIENTKPVIDDDVYRVNKKEEETVNRLKELSSSLDKEMKNLETKPLVTPEVQKETTEKPKVMNVYSSVYVPNNNVVTPEKVETPVVENNDDFDDTMEIELPKLKTEEPVLRDNTSDSLNLL